MKRIIFLSALVLAACKAHKESTTYLNFEGDPKSERNISIVTWDKSYLDGMQFVPDPRDSNNRVCQMSIIPTYKRCEIRDEEKLKLKHSRWYSFKAFIPTQGSYENMIIAQWKSKPDKGEAKRSPPLSLRDYNGRIKVYRCYNTKKIQLTNSRNKQLISEFEIEKDRWNNFLVYLQPDPWGKGRAKIWLNDSLVCDYIGPIAYNDDKGLKCKIGAYSSSKTEHYSILFDEYASGNTKRSLRRVQMRHEKLMKSSNSMSSILPIK